MKTLIIMLSVMMIAGSILGADADAASSGLRLLKAPKGVTLNPQQQKLLDEANAAIQEAYDLAYSKASPGKAADTLRKAVAAANIMKSFKKGYGRTDAGVATAIQMTTPADQLKSEGGLESLVEIALDSPSMPTPEIDNGLHKRKIIKEVKDALAGLKLKQENLSKQLDQMATTGGGGDQQPDANDPKKPQNNQNQANRNQGGQNQPNQNQNNQNQNQNNQNQGGGQAQANQNQPNQNQPNQNQNNQNQGGGQAQANQNQPNQDNQANQNQGGQNQPNQNQANQNQANQNQGGQNQPNQNQNNQNQGGGQAQANQNQPNQNNQANQNQGGQNQPNANQANQNQAGQAQANQNQGNQNQPGRPGASQTANRTDLAGQQEHIARELYKQATEMMPGGTGNPDSDRASDAFRNAAESAMNTAGMIRQGAWRGARDSSRETERRMEEAFKNAGISGNNNLLETLRAMENDVARLQDKEKTLIGQANDLNNTGRGGGQASEDAQSRMRQGVATEQIKLKARVEELEKKIRDLAETMGGGESSGQSSRSAENAAMRELNKTAEGIANSKMNQAAVNASVRAGQGDMQTALKEMAEVQKGLESVREGLSAADRAASAGGDNAQISRNLRDLQNLVAELQRIKETAKAAAGNAAQAQTDDKSGKPSRNQAGNTGGQSSKSSSDQMSGALAGTLNAAARQVQQETSRIAGEVKGTAPTTSAEVLETVKNSDPSFESGIAGSLGKIDNLLVAMDKLIKDLSLKLGDENEKKAMRSYLKDGIPGTYRDVVKAYYDELARERQKDGK